MQLFNYSIIQPIESEHLPKITTVFCSDMARTCGNCGALTVVMELSLSLGSSSLGDKVQSIYGATQRLITEFEDEFGGKDCQQRKVCTQ